MTMYRFDYDDIEYEVPGKFELCPRCEGAGKHDHPAFENGLTQSDFEEDPDFREEYLAGRYDVPCEECHGQRVVVVPDCERLSPEEKEVLNSYQEMMAEDARERAHERRMARLGIEY